MLNRFAHAAFILASLGFAACTIERAPAAAPTPPPAEVAPPAAPVAAPTPIVEICKPVGLWRMAGPAGAQEVKITGSVSKPGTYDVSYKGATLGAGSGTQDGSKVTVDLGKSTGGIYNCVLQADCRTMACGFAGQQPQVFNRAD
jgi:hypothetical protein